MYSRGKKLEAWNIIEYCCNDQGEMAMKSGRRDCSVLRRQKQLTSCPVWMWRVWKKDTITLGENRIENSHIALQISVTSGLLQLCLMCLQFFFLTLLIFVCSGCHSKHHTLRGGKNRNLFSHSSRGCKYKMKSTSQFSSQ